MIRRTLLRVGGLLAVLLVASTGPALATDCTIGPDWKVESVRLLNAGGRLVTNYVELGDVIALISGRFGRTAQVRNIGQVDRTVYERYAFEGPCRISTFRPHKGRGVVHAENQPA